MNKKKDPNLPLADRYVSFCNIDCDGMAEQILPLARMQLKVGGFLENPFWKRFDEKAEALMSGQKDGVDALYLVCSHVMYLAEVFEADGAEDARELLDTLEVTCC